ncbi:UDP-2,4-diacetamido-2,4,6-trideoxy-beta-L-altropyranose hydrolase [Aestuariibacter salexigens]|uniref:UDP-2,4-diacetamido-2,4, 6-trideoxy-beta-L-altropyranose hydrolase n=1 Tax=Aestuariibacter salexigens TaxID=226010 RepID=UPI0004042D01|nr:UDP-2,4-diacetamido-2,4,6-trideoxy-beta-L-altropyranose hydrolase [Aestuariibacter salexigens]
MLAIFRVEGNHRIGLGHLMRCQALAQTLAIYDIASVFVVSQQTAKLARQRHDWVGQLSVLSDVDEEMVSLAALIDKQSDVFVVLDGYQFSADYRSQLKSLTPVLVLFDDNNNAGRLYADVIINGSDAAQDLGYQQSEPQATLCLGGQYRVLRREFIQPPMPEWPQRRGLLIAMGGSDVANLTMPLLHHLESAGFEAPVRVLTGAAYPYLNRLQEFLAYTGLAVQHIHDCQHMADMMVQARLAVSAAGSTQFELLACHTPSILVTVAENQLAATEKAASQGWCDVIDVIKTMPVETLCDRVMTLWRDQERLTEMHRQAIRHAVPNGADNVVAAIINRVRRSSPDA